MSPAAKIELIEYLIDHKILTSIEGQILLMNTDRWDYAGYEPTQEEADNMMAILKFNELEVEVVE